MSNVNKAFKLVISIGKEEIEFSSRDKTLRFGTFDIEEGMVVIQRLAPRNMFSSFGRGWGNCGKHFTLLSGICRVTTTPSSQKTPSQKQ
mmetsp:Transcript_38736/g.53997  ORF Transcript_38736/g.53997 Transcript_38736/m.53997 type:complete len:89 (+) Transcript_38736:91-357(+)